MEFSFEKEPGKELLKQNKEKQKSVNPKLSIITPFYNSGKYFEQTYCCIMNQTLEEFEWIIINDGSSNGQDVELLETLAKTDERIKVFHQANGGQSKAKNYGIQKSCTEIIVFIDADDLVEPFYLEILYQALTEHPNAGWSYTDLVGFAAEEYVWCKSFSAGRMTFNNILVNSAAFRKSVIEQAGGFPEVEKHYDEDWALYLKILGNSVHPVHIPIIGFWYRKSNTGMQQTVRNNEELRKKSDEYIQQLAKHVDIRITEEVYCGKLPDNAVRSEYSRVDRILARILRSKIGCEMIKALYKMRNA